MSPPPPPPTPPLNHHSTTITPTTTTDAHGYFSLPAPYKVGKIRAIKINEEIYKKSSLSCDHLLLGRFFLTKGLIPKITSLEVNLISTLKIHEDFKISSLGKGFYVLSFSSLEEKFKILSKSCCKLSFGFFKFFSWKFDFSPSRKFTFSHVWVRFHALPLEYWHPQILFSIANVIGVPINISKYTLEKVFGFYAKVLVEVDASCSLPSSILIERDSFSFVLDVSYENLPSWCKHCGFLGHESSGCKNLSKLGSNGSSKALQNVHSVTLKKFANTPSRRPTAPELVVSENKNMNLDEEKKIFLATEGDVVQPSCSISMAVSSILDQTGNSMVASNGVESKKKMKNELMVSDDVARDHLSVMASGRQPLYFNFQQVGEGAPVTEHSTRKFREEGRCLGVNFTSAGSLKKGELPFPSVSLGTPHLDSRCCTPFAAMPAQRREMIFCSVTQTGDKSVKSSCCTAQPLIRADRVQKGAVVACTAPSSFCCKGSLERTTVRRNYFCNRADVDPLVPKQLDPISLGFGVSGFISFQRGNPFFSWSSEHPFYIS